MAQIDIVEFHNDFFQEIISEANASGIFTEDAFFDVFTEALIDAGEFEEAVRSHYHVPGMHVDGHCGDPKYNKESSDISGGTLSLIALDFSPSPELETLTNTSMEAQFKRLERFIEKSRDVGFRASLEPSNPAFDLADLIGIRWSDTRRIKLYLLTNRKLSTRVDGKAASEIEGKEVLYSVWDINRLHRFIEAGQEREPLRIDFTELPGGPLRTLLASSTDSENPVYLAAIPGEDLAAIYDRWGTRLLEQNVRVFLQARSNVNKGIKRTIENEPQLFFSFNNGITATATGIETRSYGGQLEITALQNLQIVNGGQTTASIYAAFKNKTDISRVYVQMKLTIIEPEDATTLVPRISEYANSQNKVNAADFFANHPFHQRIEEFSRRIYAPAANDTFQQTKWFYERARGQYNDAKAYLTKAQKTKFEAEYPKRQSFTKTDLAKYFMAWEEQPHIVARGAQKNFAAFAKIIAKQWEAAPNKFNEYFYKSIVAKKIIFNAAERIVPTREWYEAGGYRAQHVALAVGLLAHAAHSMGKEVDFIGIWNRQALSPAMEDALGFAADAAHEVLLRPADKYRNTSEWAKQELCWKALTEQHVDWPIAWIKELQGKGEAQDQQREARNEQKMLNGIEAQAMVIKAGGKFWRDVYNWCVDENEASPRERNIMNLAGGLPNTMPSERQALVLTKMMARLESQGCPFHLENTTIGRPQPSNSA